MDTIKVEESRFCSEMFTKLMKLERENGQLVKDNEWLRRALALALRNGSIVIRSEDLAGELPDITQEFNCADEIVLTVRCK